MTNQLAAAGKILEQCNRLHGCTLSRLNYLGKSTETNAHAPETESATPRNAQTVAKHNEI
jgi:hypothetical protein